MEDRTIGRPAHGGEEGRWVQRAVNAGPQGPVPQPPHTPGPVRGDMPIRIMHAPAPVAPQPLLPQAPKRDYIDEPIETPHLNGPAHTAYAGDLFSETDRYARLALAVAKGEKFSAVHAHDWMTFEAAMAVASASGKPLIVQIHSTELDRAGGDANGRIMEMERQGMVAADRVIAVSYKTKTQLIEKYGNRSAEDRGGVQRYGRAGRGRPPASGSGIAKEAEDGAVRGKADAAERAGVFSAGGAEGAFRGAGREIRCRRQGRFAGRPEKIGRRAGYQKEGWPSRVF